MRELLDALATFFEHLADVRWAPAAVAVGFHVLRLAARAFAWRAILAAAHPGARVRWWGVFGSYVAGVGVNSLAPARGGDLLKLFLVKRRIAGSTYPTLASTLLVETLFDAAVGSLILAWALAMGAFPSLELLPDLPTIDWHWPLNHPRWAIPIAAFLVALVLALAVFGARRVREFWARVEQGFAILRDPGRFFRGVVLWQSASWGFRIATVAFFLEAFGIPATVENVVLVLAVQSLSTLLPFTPGGVGTQQGFLVYVFRDEPVAKTVLLSFSVGMHVAITVVNAALGLLAILVMLRTIRWRRVVAGEENAYARGP